MTNIPSAEIKARMAPGPYRLCLTIAPRRGPRPRGPPILLPGGETRWKPGGDYSHRLTTPMLVVMTPENRCKERVARVERSETRDRSTRISLPLNAGYALDDPSQREARVERSETRDRSTRISLPLNAGYALSR
jgi:hypothetical protein